MNVGDIMWYVSNSEDELYHYGIKGMRENELCHYGVKGQKWGVRRFQNPDGTLTAEGKTRYSTDKDMKKLQEKRFELIIRKLKNSGMLPVLRHGLLKSPINL